MLASSLSQSFYDIHMEVERENRTLRQAHTHTPQCYSVRPLDTLDITGRLCVYVFLYSDLSGGAFGV